MSRLFITGGTLIASGTAREIQNNEAVISAYLGVNDDDA